MGHQVLLEETRGQSIYGRAGHGGFLCWGLLPILVLPVLVRVTAALPLPVAPLAQICPGRTGAVNYEDVEVESVQQQLVREY